MFVVKVVSTSGSFVERVDDLLILLFINNFLFDINVSIPVYGVKISNKTVLS